MKLTSLSKKVRTILGTRGYAIGLITILSAIQGMHLVQTAQAQAIPAGKPGSVCSDAYFANPDYMYDPRPGKEKDMVDKYISDPIRDIKRTSIWAKSKTFSVASDAPVGYVAKKVNGKPIAIPSKLGKEMNDAAFNARYAPKGVRKRVAELNQKYSQYATFGQQITLIFSPEQIRENTKMTREYNAYVASVMTPQQKQREQETVRAAAKQAGMCPAIFNPDSMRSANLEVGKRPDLDKRLREDKTGATFFK
jgi:hypothetical protein